VFVNKRKSGIVTDEKIPCVIPILVLHSMKMTRKTSIFRPYNYP